MSLRQNGEQSLGPCAWKSFLVLLRNIQKLDLLHCGPVQETFQELTAGGEKILMFESTNPDSSKMDPDPKELSSISEDAGEEQSGVNNQDLEVGELLQLTIMFLGFTIGFFTLGCFM